MISPSLDWQAFGRAFEATVQARGMRFVDVQGSLCIPKCKLSNLKSGKRIEAGSALVVADWMGLDLRLFLKPGMPDQEMPHQPTGKTRKDRATLSEIRSRVEAQSQGASGGKVSS